MDWRRFIWVDIGRAELLLKFMIEPDELAIPIGCSTFLGISCCRFLIIWQKGIHVTGEEKHERKVRTWGSSSSRSSSSVLKKLGIWLLSIALSGRDVWFWVGEGTYIYQSAGWCCKLVWFLRTWAQRFQGNFAFTFFSLRHLHPSHLSDTSEKPHGPQIRGLGYFWNITAKH